MGGADGSSMRDQTQAFLVCVRRSNGGSLPHALEMRQERSARGISPYTTSPYLEHATALLGDIRLLQEEVRGQRMRYLNPMRHYASRVASRAMGQAERDAFDGRMQDQLKAVSMRLEVLKQELMAPGEEEYAAAFRVAAGRQGSVLIEGDVLEHRKGALLALLKAYEEVGAEYQELYQAYAEQQLRHKEDNALRVRRHVDVSADVLRDSSGSPSIRNSTELMQTVLSSYKGFRRFLPHQKKAKEEAKGVRSTSSPLVHKETGMTPEIRNRKAGRQDLSSSSGLVSVQTGVELEEMLEEERREAEEKEAARAAKEREEKNVTSQAVLEQENQELVKELENTFDRVRGVEQQVTEIAALQETFSTKVSSQAEEIDLLHSVTVQSSERLAKSVDILRQCATDSSDFRLFVLVFVCCMSVGVLFLHWYN